ncbi:transposase IS3/IS911 family protein, partial [mine drainage metagenome]
MAGNSTPSGKPVSGTKRTAAQKLATVVETASLNEAELGEYCRGTGLYPDEVHAWRAAAEAALGGGLVPLKQLREAKAADQKRLRALERELRRKEKALAETAALLTLRKKAAA